TALVAMMATAPGRSPSRCDDESWCGPVFLPNKRGKGVDPVKFFPARLAGTTCHYPFLASADRLTIRPPQDDPALRSLVESNFTGKEWGIREDASHGKGKTVARDSVAMAFG